ncbi:hypothetical protein [Flavobacterium soli]|uniref:hypothetical protein n=1 Tax=Flavobacterium soli TaxID=344881 RepID=UPI0004094F94|nr:hypothetical protein [Flavobacterium soli]
MKKNIVRLLLFTSSIINAQVVDLKSPNHPADMTQGSYIKDVDADFDKFDGTLDMDRSPL